MAKRTASTDLNHLNWNEEDEPEDAGEFKRATNEVLQRRVIKTARRRNPISNVGETPKSSVFGNFSGFAGKPAPVPSTAFSFLNNLNKDTEKETSINGTNMLGVSKVTNSPLFQSDNKKEEDGEYLAKIKALNESVSNWIKSKVDQNPYVDLKPIFKDYEKHFNDLKNNDNKQDYSTLSFKPIEQTDKKEDVKKSPSKGFVFGIPKTTEKPQENLLKNPVTSIFKTDKDDKAETKPTFTFGAPKNDSKTFTFGIPTSTPMFSFGAPTTSTFTLPTTSTISLFSSNITKPQTNEVESKNDDEEDEPPTNDFTPVIEEGHVFTTKCKVFVKADGKYGDRGVGTLYLKPVPDSEKIQLIVRADTSLGKVLCNFILSQSIPTKRMGKKDIMLVAVPTPDSKPPPVPVLIRVKSPEEADQLLGELEKHKK